MADWPAIGQIVVVRFGVGWVKSRQASWPVVKTFSLTPPQMIEPVWLQGARTPTMRRVT